MRLDDLELFVQSEIKIFASYTIERRSNVGATFKITHEVEPGRVWKCGEIQIFVKDAQVHFMSQISNLAQQDERSHHQLIVGSILGDLIEKGVIVMDAKNSTKATAKPGATSGAASNTASDTAPDSKGKIKITDNRTPPKPPIRWGMSEQKFYSDAEGEIVVAHLMTGERLEGELIGLDVFTIAIQPGDNLRVLLPKHAIAFIHVKAENAENTAS
jgi:sRNA-binding regulator protein Hfq